MATTPSNPPQGFTRRTLLTMGVAGVSALALAGCTNATKSAASSTPVATRKGSGTVGFASFDFGTAGTEAPLHSVDTAFTTSTGINVTETAIPYANMLDQLVIKGKGGNLSGIAHIDEAWLSTLATAGVLKNVAKHYDASLYPKSVQAMGTFRGTRYALPWTQSGIGMIGNKEILSNAGISTSIATVDDFTKALRALKRSDSQLVPYCPATNVLQLKDIIPWMWTFGSPIVQGKTVTLGDAGSLKAIEYWKQLIDEGLVGKGLQRNDARTLFAQGRAAIYDDAPQAISVIPAQSSDSKIASKMVPMARPTVKSGGTPRSLVWCQPLVSFDEDPSSFTLMKYLSTNTFAVQTMFEQGGQPPTTVKALGSTWFTGDAFNNLFNQRIAAHATNDPFWSFPAASAAETEFEQQVELALAGTTSAKAAMKTAKDALQAML